jgi:hypothetical protein
VQCSVLPHLDLSDNPNGDGAQRLIESWNGPEGGLIDQIWTHGPRGLGRKLLR